MCDDKITFEDLHELPDASECRATVSKHSEAIGGVTLFIEDCPKCNGTGMWRGIRTCFKCKGKGKLEFKTAPEARAKSRKYAKTSKAKRAEENKAAFAEYLAAHKPVADWLNANNDNTFALSLLAAGDKYGSLTDGQQNAVLNAIARDEDGAAAFEKWAEDNEDVHAWLVANAKTGNEFAGSLLSYAKRKGQLSTGQLNAVLNNVEKDKEKAKTETPSDIDLSSLPKGYYAVPNGDTRLKIAVRRPGKNSNWQGWTFVDAGAAYGNRQTYGKQAPDGLYAGKIQDQLKEVLADPKAAMVAYGKLTGTCGKCGRILEDETSVAAGIGPICASKM